MRARARRWEPKIDFAFLFVSRDEEGHKRVEKVEIDTHNPNTLRYIEKKMRDKGIQCMEHPPADNLNFIHNPKSGHDGKYTWEGSDDIAKYELSDVPPTIDEGDPNYVNEGEVDVGAVGEEVNDLVVGEVHVLKVAKAKEGVSRVEVYLPFRSDST